MITLEAYRSSIGTFCSARGNRTRRSEINNANGKDDFLDFLKYSASYSSVAFPVVLGVFILIVIMMLNFNYASFKLLLLLSADDVETNPGPEFSLSKIIFASTNQGDFKYGETAGFQCACNALISACWSLCKKPSFWNKQDLDTILDKGDHLIKVLGYDRSLFVDELPSNVSIDQCVFNVDHIALETSEIRPNNFDFLKHHFNVHANDSNAVIIFIAGYAFSLMWAGKCFFIFDSHSHNDQGIYAPDGISVSIKFSSLLQVHKYLIEKYLSSQGSLLFQMVFMNIYCRENEQLKSLAQAQKNFVRRRLYNSNVVGTPQHEANLEKRRYEWSKLTGTLRHANILKNKSQKRNLEKGTPEHQVDLDRKRKQRAEKVALLNIRQI